MKCIICNNKSDGITKIFSHKILQKYEIEYNQCLQCGLIFTETPYWLSEAYNDSISVRDTGILRRNISYSMDVNIIITLLLKRNARQCSFLDYAGGFGIFTRMMRDLGWDFYWLDKYTENILARGFEYCDQKVSLVTLFEAFEHFEDPIFELKNLLTYSDNILFSTLIYDKKLQAKDKDWWYYSFDTGQHIVFYSKVTLDYMAKQFNLEYYCFNEGLHLFSKHKFNAGIMRFTFIHKILKYILWQKSMKKSLASSDMHKIPND